MTQDISYSSATFDETRETIHRQMLSAVSHDLKTPLATIIGSLEVYTRMLEKLSPEKRKTLISSALMEAYRLDNFITNILDMAKLESGMVKVTRDQCNMTLMLQDCLTRLGPKREKGKIILNALGSSIVYTDPMLLGRAVGLLLENALKHAGKSPQIFVDYKVEDHKASICVRDDGPGIPQGKESDIFSKYTRLSKSDQQNAGTGLGLPICKCLMETLSGSVGVANHPEGGAIFTLTFPAH